MEYNEGVKGKIVMFRPKGRWSAPPGDLAIVTGFSVKYIRLQWISRELFGNHMQMDGDYFWGDVELQDDPVSLEDLV